MGWVDRNFPRLAVLPTTLLMLLVFGLPLLFSAWLSLEAWSPDQTLFGGKFAGIANYQDLLTDPEFAGSLILTLEYTAAVVAAELAAGLGIALLLNIDLPWIGLFRTLLIVPMMITPVVAAFCWKLLLDPDHGVVNYFISQHIVWLGRPDTALLSVAVVNVWQNAPYVAILLLAGLRSLPHEPVEAARIDGASRVADVLAHHRAAAAPVSPGGPAAADDLRVPVVRQRLRHDQRRTGQRHHGAVDVHLPGLVRALRPQPGRGVVLDDAADLADPVRLLHRRWSAGGTPTDGGTSRGPQAAGRSTPSMRADRADGRVPVSAAVDPRPVAEDPVAGLRLAAAVPVVADAGELRRHVVPSGFRRRPSSTACWCRPAPYLCRCWSACPPPTPWRGFRFAGRNVLFFALLAMRMLPPIAVLVPMYVLFSAFGLTTTRTSVVLAYTTFSLPLVVWIMRGFFEDLPQELEESAWVDGASRFQAFVHVVLPLIKPGLVAACILCLQLAWNDFLFAAVLTSNATRTLPVLMAAFSGGDTGVDWGGMTASGVLVVLPVICLRLRCATPSGRRAVVRRGQGVIHMTKPEQTPTARRLRCRAALPLPALAQGKPEKLVYVGDNGPWHWVMVEEVAPAFEKATGIKIDFTLLPVDPWTRAVESRTQRRLQRHRHRPVVGRDGRLDQPAHDGSRGTGG